MPILGLFNQLLVSVYNPNPFQNLILCRLAFYDETCGRWRPACSVTVRACVGGVGNAQGRVGVDTVDTNIVPVWGAQQNDLVRSFIVKWSPQEVNLYHPTGMVFFVMTLVRFSLTLQIHNKVPWTWLLCCAAQDRESSSRACASLHLWPPSALLCFRACFLSFHMEVWSRGPRLWPVACSRMPLGLSMLSKWQDFIPICFFKHLFIWENLK